MNKPKQTANARASGASPASSECRRWRVRGARHGVPFEVEVTAPDYNAAVRIGSTKHLMVVTEACLRE